MKKEHTAGVAVVKEICPVCGKQYDGDLLFNMAVYNEAANKRVADMHGKAVGFMKEPCEKCQAFMKQGVILVGVDETKTTDMKNPYRTGRFQVVKDDAIRRMFDSDTAEHLLKVRVGFITVEATKESGLDKIPDTDEKS